MNISVNQYNDNELSQIGTSDVYFDTCGNMYIEYMEKMHQICIDGKNDIYTDVADYSILSHDSIECGYIMDIEKNTSNKETVMDIIEQDEDDVNSDDEFYDENDPFGSVSDRFYVEEKDYMFSISVEDYSLSQFYFCKRLGTDNFLINKRKNGDINALYDTFIYNNDKCLFRSKLIGEPPLYVVKVYPHHINLRDIYDIDYSKNYKILLDGSEISLIKIS